MNCLKTRNFDEILTTNPITSDEEYNPEFLHVSGFGIRMYSLQNVKANENREGMFFNFLLKEDIPKTVEDQLKRYQIYDSLVDEKGNRKCEL